MDRMEWNGDLRKKNLKITHPSALNCAKVLSFHRHFNVNRHHRCHHHHRETIYF